MKSKKQSKRPSIIPGLCRVYTGILLLIAASEANAAATSFQEGQSPDAAYTIGATYLHSNKWGSLGRLTLMVGFMTKYGGL